MTDAPAAASAAKSVAKASKKRAMLDPQRPSWATLMMFLLPAISLLIVFRLAPIAISIGGSFTSQSLLGETTFHGLGNYDTLFSDEGFWNSVRVTLLFNIIINPLQIFVAFIMALLVFAPGRFLTFFRVSFFLPMTMSTALVAVMWNLLFDPNLGLVNSILAQTPLGRQGFFFDEDQALGAMIWISTWKGAGYYMIFLLAGLFRISEELYEAAHVDGASPWQQLRLITLPQMKRTFLFVFVADTTVNLLFFAPVYIITRGGPNGTTDTLMYRAYESSFTFVDWGRALSLSCILLALVVLVAAAQMLFFKPGEGE
ncbi:carbohydrate ABC transporter permease [Tateyamaria sp.]|uniref:carbohydrate ABC transporter permease n=1 Tax=Tateyamaria sp. TaxID=1929288 RepID=UPI0032A03267